MMVFVLVWALGEDHSTLEMRCSEETDEKKYKQMNRNHWLASGDLAKNTYDN